MFTCSFYERKSQKHKMTHVIFMFLGSVPVKAARNMLEKSTSGFNFINILSVAFTHADTKAQKRLTT